MESLKIIIDIINSISTVLLVIVAIIGLQQLTISKETRKINSKREAFKLAAEQTHLFAEKIIPEIDVLNKKIQENELNFFLKSKVNFNDTEISVTPYIKDYSVKKMDEIAPNLSAVLNSLESFSLFFVSGVAAENTAYDSCAHSFVSTIKKLMPFIIIVTNKEGGYKNILKLFVTWRNRLEADKLIIEKLKINEKLKKTKKATIKPLGT